MDNNKLINRITQSLNKEFVVVGKERVRSWHAWLIIGLVAGATAGVGLVANRSGEFENTSAALTTNSKIISACGDIVASGDYVLDRDLVTPVDRSSCIQIKDISNIKLDCAGHKISTVAPSHLMYLEGVENFSISSCLFDVKDMYSLYINNSRNGLIINNKTGDVDFRMVRVDGSNNLRIENNIFGSYVQDKSTNITIINNMFGTTANVSKVVLLTNGSNNFFIGNQIDAHSDGVFSTMIGNDDALFMANEDADTIQNNIIKNSWDCGIETGNVISNTKFIGNTIINHGYCGIGGWYYSSFKSNTVSNNIFENVPQMFAFNYFLKNTKQNPSNVPTIYFKDNIFENNKLMSIKNSQVYSSVLRIDSINDPSKQFLLENNIIKNNNFGLEKTLNFSPQSMIVDGGGNICKPSAVSGFPITCNSIVSPTPTPPQSTAPAVSVSSNTVTPGGAVTVKVVNGPANALDWVGLYNISASNETYLDWKYLNNSKDQPGSGVANATLNFTMPSEVGDYEFRLLENDGYTSITSSPIVKVANAPILNFSLTTGGNKSVIQGSSVTNSVTASLLSPASNSVTFSAVATPALTGGTFTFSPSTCSPTCSTTFTVKTSATTPKGSYVIKVSTTGGGTTKESSFALTVNDPLAITTATLPAGTVGKAYLSTITTTGVTDFRYFKISAGSLPPGLTLRDNICEVGTACNITPKISGTPTTAGTYSFTATILSGSQTASKQFTIVVSSVTLAPTPTPIPKILTPSASTVSSGSAISVKVVYNSLSTSDWVAIFPTTGDGSSYSGDWKYLNGQQEVPSFPILNANLNFTAPTTPGNYQFRLYRNNSVDASDLIFSAGFIVQ